MRKWVITLLIGALCACGGSDSDSQNDATELRDWAKSHTSKAELTAKLAEAKMTLRVVAQADPNSDEARQLKETIARLEQQLNDIENNARN